MNWVDVRDWLPEEYISVLCYVEISDKHGFDQVFCEGCIVEDRWKLILPCSKEFDVLFWTILTQEPLFGKNK